MGQVLLQRDQYLEQGAVSTGADAAALYCRSLGDTLSMAGRLKSVYGMRGHINPITSNLVVMVFIAAGAFPHQWHLGSVEHTCTNSSYITHFYHARVFTQSPMQTHTL